MNVTRILESREVWKRTAKERRLAIESLKRKNEVLRRKAQAAEAEVRSYQDKLREMSASTRPIVIQPILRIEVRVVCVMLFLVGFVPCNSIARILGFLA